jgi:hypothetical protein
MGGSFAIDWRLIGSVLFGLFFAGVAYNFFVDKLDERKVGYLAPLVVGGVILTLIGMAFVSWQSALLALACFVVTGTPMYIGEAVRNIRKREKALNIQRMIAECEAEKIEEIANQIENNDQG